jgi:hypothetical protein
MSTTKGYSPAREAARRRRRQHGTPVLAAVLAPLPVSVRCTNAAVVAAMVSAPAAPPWFGLCVYCHRPAECMERCNWDDGEFTKGGFEPYCFGCLDRFGAR